MKGAARVLDPTVHGGLLNTGAPNVLVNGRPAVRVGDHHGCMQHGPGPVMEGSPMVWIGGRPMARVGDLLMCIGAGSGTDEKGGASVGGGSAEGGYDAENYEAHGKIDKHLAKGETSDAGGYIKYRGTIGEAKGEGRIGPGGVSGSGEASAAKGEVQIGTDDDNLTIEAKSLGVEGEQERWVGKQDGKYGFGYKDKRGGSVGSVKVTDNRKYSAGDYGFESSESAEIGAGNIDGEMPVGGWASYDPEAGEICIGGYGEVEIFPGLDVEIMRQYKFRWKPPKPGGAGGGGGMGAIPNNIAAGSFDVFLG